MRSISLLILVLAGCGDYAMNPAPPISKADGLVEDWTTMAPLTTPLANHCAVAMGDTLIIAGGNYKPAGSDSFVSVDEIRAAKVATDGSLGTWDLIGHLPGAGTECALAASRSTLVLLGGLFENDTLDGNVWSTTLGADGQLTGWVNNGTLPYGRRALTAGAALVDGTLWLTDGQLASEGPEESIIATAIFAPTLGAWTKTKYWPQFRGKPLGAFTESALFIAGGYDDSGVLTDVTAVSLQGTPTASTTALPEARTYGAAATTDDGFIFATGGRTQVLGAAPLPSVFSASVTGPTLGAWAMQTPMPEARSNHTATVVGDWLFVVGGGNDGPGLDTVFRARVKHAPPATQQ